ncbi:MAG: DMT family transporter [Ruminococcus sp.]|nr:DMT family transporter [Ruminococcus sp.]
MRCKENILTKTPAVIMLAFICSVLWGSAFSGVKIGYEKFGIDFADWSSQMIFAGVRFAIAGIMALVFGSISAHKVLLPTRRSVPKIMVISMFQTILQYIFYYIGLAHTTGVKAVVIVAANCFMAILISSLIYKTEKLTLHKMIGCILRFSGIIIINLSELCDS